MQTLRNDANIVANAGTLAEIREQLSVLIEEAAKTSAAASTRRIGTLRQNGRGTRFETRRNCQPEPSALCN